MFCTFYSSTLTLSSFNLCTCQSLKGLFCISSTSFLTYLIQNKPNKENTTNLPTQKRKRNKEKENISSSSSFAPPLKQYNNNVSPKQRTSHKTLRASPSAFSNAPPFHQNNNVLPKQKQRTSHKNRIKTDHLILKSNKSGVNFQGSGRNEEKMNLRPTGSFSPSHLIVTPGSHRLHQF